MLEPESMVSLCHRTIPLGIPAVEPGASRER